MKSVDFSDKGHVETIRETYDTENTRAVLGRFYSAVSWRESGDN